MPGDSGVLVVTRVRSITTSAHEAAGALGIRHSPRPLWAEDPATPRALRVARANVHLESRCRHSSCPGLTHARLARSVLIMPPSPWRHEHAYGCAVAPHGLHVVRSQIWAVVAWGVAQLGGVQRPRADASGLFG